MVALAAVTLSATCLAASVDESKPTGKEAVSASRNDAREAKVERIVIEDDGSRIEELRVRSQTRSIHVQTKGVLRGGYEVIPADPARDTAAGPSNGGGSSGKRVWKVLAF